MTNADILGLCKNQLSPPGQRKREYGCENKENYDATNSLYNPTPQKVTWFFHEEFLYDSVYVTIVFILSSDDFLKKNIV